MSNTRSDMLADLADAINELTEPRQNVEIMEASVTKTITTRSGKIRAKRTRERRKHTVTLPGLLDELRSAAIPGSGEGGAATGGFESRPSAELEPLSVLREIDHDAGYWSRRFAIERDTLADTLHALVSAPHDDEQLATITRQASRWVHRARLATGHEPLPITLNEPCPYCFRRHALVIAGDLRSAKCTRCFTRWSPDTIGLLADMLRTSETQETATAVRCWMGDCTRVGVHDEHQDDHGHTWGDACEVAPVRRDLVG